MTADGARILGKWRPAHDRGGRGGARRMREPEVTRHPTLAPERARPGAWPLVLALLAVTAPGRALASDGLDRVETSGAVRDPKTLVWYAHPADKWENALPVGNGRLGAMVFGRTDEEQHPAQRGDALVGRAVFDRRSRAAPRRCPRSGGWSSTASTSRPTTCSAGT